MQTSKFRIFAMFKFVKERNIGMSFEVFAATEFSKSCPGELRGCRPERILENIETLFYSELIVCDLFSSEALSAASFTCGKLNTICVSHSRHVLRISLRNMHIFKDVITESQDLA
jgi:hypothetical protein